jgi:hypothetical protein
MRIGFHAFQAGDRCAPLERKATLGLSMETGLILKAGVRTVKEYPSRLCALVR